MQTEHWADFTKLWHNEKKKDSVTLTFMLPRRSHNNQTYGRHLPPDRSKQT